MVLLLELVTDVTLMMLLLGALRAVLGGPPGVVCGHHEMASLLVLPNKSVGEGSTL